MTTIKIFDTSNPPPMELASNLQYDKPWSKDEAIQFAVDNPKRPSEHFGVPNNTWWDLPMRQTGKNTFSHGSVIRYSGKSDFEVKIKTKKLKTFLCIGGPWNGSRHPIEEASDNDYVSFNHSGYGQCDHSCVLIYKDLL